MLHWGGNFFLQKILNGKLDVKYVKVEGLAADLSRAKEMMIADNNDPTPKVITILPIWEIKEELCEIMKIFSVSLLLWWIRH